MAKAIRILPLLVTLVALLMIWQRMPDVEWDIAYSSTPNPDSAVPVLRSDFVSTAPDQFVHAASIAAMPEGRLLSAWFGGSREGARDVNIYGAVFDPARGRWGQNKILASRKRTEQGVGRTIRKLGNPVVSQAPDGKLWLFYVSVSVGGWAGSALNASYSVDGGQLWTTPRRLVTSPFLNISTLVKGTPIFYHDGTIGLPIYHEFLGKFAELLRLDAQGRVLDKARISHGKHSLQPVIVAADNNNAVALMRYAGAAPKRMLASRSSDGGNHWPIPHKTAVANSNSALAALRLQDGSILGVMNDLEDGRHRLSLLRSTDEGENWHVLRRLEGDTPASSQRLAAEDYRVVLERDFYDSIQGDATAQWQRFSTLLDQRVCDDGSCRFIYDYPFMIQAPDGQFHLVYTWNKSFIKHLQFNQAWLDTL